ncbi:hypothetical protein CEUSTIGMA_g10558.t1 [Chlamydomonas eustigma]|uniref:Sulfotransferase n=1 Tax=Chlamydomonas eustigma TaxID=1157962 RepID=A0A250XJP1_9CHLO|nr:hypothetical protein CEUSTIGMA_g10558.t1 [Chlamydomonas eustigma]|eukprot:GAX83132.1 hypothetical protein CEUSTIGMA_g10558.t1 [Chlamydomonas eustigma]
MLCFFGKKLTRLLFLLLNLLLLLADNRINIFAEDPVQRLLQSISDGCKRRDIVVYNRVPKTGSSSFQKYIDNLAGHLNFKAYHFGTPPWIACSEGSSPCKRKDRPYLRYELSRLRDRILKFSNGSDAVIDYHFAYINFGTQLPLHINMVREPISRLISHYNYMRYGLQRRLEDTNLYIHKFGNLTIDECLDLYLQCSCEGDCQSPYGLNCTRSLCSDLYSGFNSQMMYFCPVDSPACAAKNESSLQAAIRVLEDKYDVVGVMEKLEDSMKLFQLVLPRYFKGMPKLEHQHVRQAARKTSPRPSSIQKLRVLNALDLQFYEHVAALLERRLREACTSPAIHQLETLMSPPMQS